MTLKATTKIKVTYADNTHRYTTVAELEALFSDENKEWIINFFAGLENNGHNSTKFARYELAGSGMFAK